jgi:protoporphyrinogen oxidase
MSKKKYAAIIGAGPAGLTAAYELLKRTDITPIVFEQSNDIGGISKTVNYKGNRIDIGGHRFFSKSKRVMDWWEEIIPLQGKPSKDDLILGREVVLSKDIKAPNPETDDIVMLSRNRVSRIFFLRRFFDYPITIRLETFKNLGIVKVVKIGFSYLKVQITPIKTEVSLEDFLINRFGSELYKLFFRDYTKKVWGVSCDQIKPEWGAQRIKGLSITSAMLHAVKSIFIKNKTLSQGNIETSLIGRFLYPKYGPGQMWERVSDILKNNNIKVHMDSTVIGVALAGDVVKNITVSHNNKDYQEVYECDFVISTMPIKELIPAISPTPAKEIMEISQGLQYRDFITVGLLLREMNIVNTTNIKSVNNIIPDNWVYIQEKDVTLGRLQIFNNWSPYMVKDPNNIWVGLEYFCNESGDFWNMTNESIKEYAINEMIKMDLISNESVIDSTVVKMPKAYPAYFGSYEKLDDIKKYLNKIENLFLVGRNGMHKYNNSDHSMLSAMVAVDNIVDGITTKDNIWSVNTEDEFHEEK